MASSSCYGCGREIWGTMHIYGRKSDGRSAYFHKRCKEAFQKGESRIVEEYWEPKSERQAARISELENLLEDGGDDTAEVAYLSELRRCQEALDMRCVDNPKEVGCEDRIFEVAREIRKRLANQPAGGED